MIEFCGIMSFRPAARRRNSRPTRTLLVRSIASLLALSVQPLLATNLIWEPDGASGAPTGGTGNWDTASSFWDNAGAMQAWNNANFDTALFNLNLNNPPFTVTLTTAISAGGLTFNSSGYTVT